MRILNLGSLNIDKVYGVEHFVAAGETISSTTFETGCGGKGLNQSVALARAGAGVAHAGAVGHHRRPRGDLCYPRKWNAAHVGGVVCVARHDPCRRRPRPPRRG